MTLIRFLEHDDYVLVCHGLITAYPFLEDCEQFGCKNSNRFAHDYFTNSAIYFHSAVSSLLSLPFVQYCWFCFAIFRTNVWLGCLMIVTGFTF